LVELIHLYREVAVSHGAILRAWNKEDGPARLTNSSYGFQIMEEYNPDKIKEHLEVKKPFFDKLDGMKYVRDIIEWHVFKVKASTFPIKLFTNISIGPKCSTSSRVFIAFRVPNFSTELKGLSM
jgi:hypothetical protein